MPTAKTKSRPPKPAARKTSMKPKAPAKAASKGKELSFPERMAKARAAKARKAK
jgi:hypothetical protein